jgi:hypothetical protein
MTASIVPSIDGKYVDVFVPIAFKRFGGRKTIVAPDGTKFLPGRSKATDSTLIKALSRAWRWQQLLDAGAYSSIAEMADKEGINRSYLSRTIRLALLAPRHRRGYPQRHPAPNASALRSRAAVPDRLGSTANGVRVPRPLGAVVTQ